MAWLTTSIGLLHYLYPLYSTCVHMYAVIPNMEESHETKFNGDYPSTANERMMKCQTSPCAQCIVITSDISVITYYIKTH